MLPLYPFCHFLLPIFHKFYIVWSDMRPEWALNTTSSLSPWQYAFTVTLHFLPDFLELLGAFHLVKISGISGSAVNGTRFVGSFHWKIPRKSGKSKRWARFPGWNFRTECRVPFTFLVVCTSSRSTVGHRDVLGFTTKWNNFLPIGNSTFTHTEISGFFS